MEKSTTFFSLIFSYGRIEHAEFYKLFFDAKFIEKCLRNVEITEEKNRSIMFFWKFKVMKIFVFRSKVILLQIIKLNEIEKIFEKTVGKGLLEHTVYFAENLILL